MTTPRLLKLDDFLDSKDEEIAYVVQGLLPIGGMSLLGGHPKAGKSTLSRNLIRQVSRGGEFLGRVCPQSVVLYYPLEELPYHVATEFRSLGCHDEPIYLRAGPIDKDDLLRLLEDDIRQSHARLAVIDPLFDALQVGDINSYSAVNDAMKEVLKIARYTDCHIMVVHHTNKSDARGGNSILGSQALAGSTDCNMFLTLNHKGERIIETQQRAGEPLERTVIEFNPDTHEMIVMESVREQRSKIVQAKMLETLGDGELATNVWRDMVKGRATDKVAAIKELELQGAIVPRREGRLTFWKKVV